MTTIKDYSWLLSLLEKSVWYLFHFSVMTFFLFFIGNYQHFSDNTQKALLYGVYSGSVLYLMLVCFSVFAMVFYVVLNRKGAGGILMRIGTMISGSILIFILLFASSTLHTIMLPY